MTITQTAVRGLPYPDPAPPLAPCPDWCRLDPEHGWDGWDPDAAILVRGHAGPNHGDTITGGRERSDAPGVVVLDAGVDDAAAEAELTPHDLRELARDCVAAAEWREAHQ